MHREQEAAQTLLCPMENIRLGEKKASVAFLSRDALGLLLVPPVDFTFTECGLLNLVLCLF